jgi:hypothetical protein
MLDGVLSRKALLDGVLSRKAFALGILAIASPFLFAQQAAITNFTTSGINADFTSTRIDYIVQPQRVQEQGKQNRNSLRSPVPVAKQAQLFSFKSVKKFCAAHPDEDCRYVSEDGQVLSAGHCLSDLDKGFAAATLFRSHHKDFIAGESNAQLMTDYLESHRLDARQEKSYEIAYKDLKKAGMLDLNAR